MTEQNVVTALGLAIQIVLGMVAVAYLASTFFDVSLSRPGAFLSYMAIRYVFVYRGSNS